MKEMPPEFSKVVQSLRSDLIELQCRWKIYDQLYVLEKDGVEILNKIAPGFFGLTQVIYRDAIVLGIARMTDEPGSEPKAGKEDKRNLSVGHALNLLDEETHPKLKNDLKRIVDKNKGDDQPWAKMRLLRNKRIAHRDLVTVKSVADPSLVYDHTAAEKALDAVRMFVKAIDKEFAKVRGSQRMYEDPILASGDASCLIRRLRKAVGYELLEVQGRVPRLDGQSISTLETMFGLSPLLERNPTSGEQPALDDSTRPG